MVVGEAADFGELPSEIELRIALREPVLSLRAGGDICNAGDPTNDGAVGITIRNGHDPEKRILRSPRKGDHTFVLDAFARKHALNAGADGFKCSLAHHLDDGPTDDLTKRQAHDLCVGLIRSKITKISAATRDADASGVQCGI